MRNVLNLLLACALASRADGAEPISNAQQVFADIKPQRPGCAASVMQNGEITWSGGFGRATIGRNRPITADTIFNVASISKQFTAFSILQLAALGKVKLDESVRTYIPDLNPSMQPVTLRQLLHHTGGLLDYVTLAMLEGTKTSGKMTEQAALDIVKKQNVLQFAPGTEFSYSNTGYFLLSVVIERVTGESMKHYVYRNIFKPLGMRESTIIDHYPTDLAGLADGYAAAKATDRQAIEESGWENAGDGQVHTTVKDLMIWERNLATGHLGGSAMVAALRTPGTLSDGQKLDYGMGLSLGTYRGVPVVSHSGGWAGYRSQVLWLPTLHFAAAVFCNADDLDPGKRAFGLAEFFGGPKLGLEGLPATPVAPDYIKNSAKMPPLSVRPGRYLDDRNQLVEIKQEGHNLFLVGDEGDEQLKASANLLTADAGGKPSYIAASAPNQIVVSFRQATSFRQGVYTRLAGWTLPHADGFVGKYTTATLNGSIAISLGTSGLLVTSSIGSGALEPIAKDRFDSILGILTFKDDGKSFTINSARNLVFLRR